LTSKMRGSELLRKALAKRYYPKESVVWLGDVKLKEEGYLMLPEDW